MPLDNALNRSQTYARAFKFGRRVQPPEGGEQLVGIGHIKTDPVVAYKKGGLVLALPKSSKLDLGLGGLGREFPSIA